MSKIKRNEYVDEMAPKFIPREKVAIEIDPYTGESQLALDPSLEEDGGVDHYWQYGNELNPVDMIVHVAHYEEEAQTDDDMSMGM